MGHRCGSDLMLLWLWCRLAAAALIQPLAWELSCAVGAALKKKKKKEGRRKEKEKKKRLMMFLGFGRIYMTKELETQANCNSMGGRHYKAGSFS